MATGPPIVVYDACVLYPAPLRDLLMHLTLAGACEARWTDAIHDEWTRNVIVDRPDLAPERIIRTRDLMDRHATDAKVVGYEHLTLTLTLPDPDDRHVLAAAIHTGASTVVTYNLRDFPAEALASHGITAEHPDDFAVERLDADPERVLLAVGRHRRSMRRPPVDERQYLELLRRQRLPRLATRLQGNTGETG